MAAWAMSILVIAGLFSFLLSFLFASLSLPLISYWRMEGPHDKSFFLGFGVFQWDRNEHAFFNIIFLKYVVVSL